MDARDLARLLLEARRENSLKRLEQRQFKPLPVTYGGTNSLKELGATGPVPAANRQQRTNLSIGEPIAAAQGLLESFGDIDNQELRGRLERLIQIIQEAANRRGILLYQGDESTNPNDDPNDEANNRDGRAYQQYDNQLVYTGDRERSGALYCHIPATAIEPETFIPVAMADESNGQNDAPVQGQVICIISSATYKSVLTKLLVKEVGGAGVASTVTKGTNLVVMGGTTISLSSSIGDAIDVNESLELTVNNTDNTRFAWTISYMRV